MQHTSRSVSHSQSQSPFVACLQVRYQVYFRLSAEGYEPNAALTDLWHGFHGVKHASDAENLPDAPPTLNAAAAVLQ